MALEKKEGIMQPVSYQSVYYVEMENPEYPVDPIAIKPTFFEYRDGDHVEKRCEWNNTGRGSHLFIKEVQLDEPVENKEQPRHFKLIGTNGEVVHFTLMTNKIFQDRVAKHTYAQPVFKDDEELQQYYLTKKFNNL